MPKPSSTCPCGGPSFATCCAPYLSGAAIAPTAEKLMRSRYTAFVQGNEDYLRATWHPSTVPAEPILQDGETIQWLGLEVKSTLRLRQRKADVVAPASLPDSPDADTVEFVARYRIAGRGHRLHEVSRFVREHGNEDGSGEARWYYLDGSFPE